MNSNKSKINIIKSFVKDICVSFSCANSNEIPPEFNFYVTLEDTKYQYLNEFLFSMRGEHVPEYFVAFKERQSLGYQDSGFTFKDGKVIFDNPLYEYQEYDIETAEAIFDEYFLTYYKFLLSLTEKHRPEWIDGFKQTLLKYYPEKVKEIENGEKFDLSEIFKN